MTGGLLVVIFLLVVLVSLIVAYVIVSRRRERESWQSGAGERQGGFAGPYSIGRYNDGSEDGGDDRRAG
jgi:hypothetical protein